MLGSQRNTTATRKRFTRRRLTDEQQELPASP
jgi:hypothetical protein